MHYFVGNLGHLLVIGAFVLSLVATYAYYQYTVSSELDKPKWRSYARVVFYLHSIAIIGVVGTLFYIINNHYFEYYYAYQHSSVLLPVYYQISCFWEGQEGSFLLWLFWNVLLGIIVINTNKFWEGPTMTVFSLVQAFLTSMILGIVLFDIKLGSSPFILLRDAITAPIFQINPEFIPEDGSGLNPLLQNYWMVIHPPTLFLGFATTMVPFAYAVSGLWIGKLREWVRPALPWALFSTLVLGVGILMGAYWAYETLNFGGYWNWDPVENAIYVPWLILVASVHVMIVFRKSNTALKAALILTITTFLSVLYATFLTRSGILGDSSVHSFTDLGLSGQLLIYLMAFVVLSVFLVARAWSKMPSTEEEVSTYSREFWIFIGTTTLCLMGFQVIIPTSIPVYNSVVELFGGISNLAPPADQVGFYTKFQMWFAIAIAILSGTGQFFYWQKMSPQELKNALLTPVVIALILSSAVIMISKMTEPAYMLLLTASLYSIVANLKILSSVLKSNYRLSGGSIAHIGVAMMLIGILFSSGYSTIVSMNNTGLVWHRDFPEEVNRNNLLLFIHEPRDMGDYTLTYMGMRQIVREVPGYVNSEDLEALPIPGKAKAKNDISSKEGIAVNAGDTVSFINQENTYFEVKYVKEDGREFTLYPRVQINDMMGIVYSPDIDRNIGQDLYTHVRTFPDPDQEVEWGEMAEQTVAVGEQFFVNDYVAEFESVERIQEVPMVSLGAEDVAIKANIKVMGSFGEYFAEPIYLIKDKMVGRIPDEVNDLAAKLTLLNVNPEENNFTVGINTRQKDYIILEAVEKPLINILWIGTLLLVVGLIIAIHRRYGEFIKLRDKGVE
ncbi:MAG: cytochrome c biogenesis protein CcsA [Bacteroidota bacterium]